jgi:hypothetical protein
MQYSIVGTCRETSHTLECESNCPQLRIVDFHSSGANVAVERLPAISVLAHCSGSHSTIVSSRSVRPLHPEPCSYSGLLLSRPAYRLSLSRAVVPQYDSSYSRFFIRAGPALGLCFPASFLFILDHSAYWCARCGVVVHLLQLGPFARVC